MASRCVLHINHLNLLDEYMDREGYTKQDTKGIYEVRRYKNSSLSGNMKTVIIFKRDNQSQHCTVMDKHINLIRNFLNELKSMRSD
jgi:hypothetical protein